jgi:hypothetical protein
MSTELRTEQIPASGKIPLGSRNFFFLLTATAVVNVTFQRRGTSFGVTGVLGGYVKGMVERWESATISGTAGTIISFFIGDEELQEDITDFRTQIASIAGVVPIIMQPLSVFTTPTKATVAAGASVEIAADLLRRKITVGNESTSANSFWLRDASDVTDAGFEVQPGTDRTVDNTAALRIRNNGAAACTYTITRQA